MNENLFDLVVDGLHEVRQQVRSELSKQYRRTKPFRMEPLSAHDQLWFYDQFTPEDMDYAVKTYGEDAMNSYVFDMEKLRVRRDKNARL